jgi:putative FmdB family regulatory protein
MPIYEYACARCDEEFEVEQRITEDPLKRCPSCRSPKVKRLISQTSFVLKGSGWYSDLYSSRKDGKSSAKDEADAGKQADAKDEADAGKQVDAKEKEASTSTEKKKPKSESNKKDKGAQAAA